MTTFHPKSKREWLAYTIADTFSDTDRLSLYLIYCKKYPSHIIQRAYGEARSIPNDRIRKSRAAVFFYLVKRYSHESKSENNSQPTKHDIGN